MAEGIFQQLKSVGSHFAFEYFLEIWKPKLIEMLREWLSGYTADEIKKMVRKGTFPDTSNLNFGAVQGYYEYIEKITALRLLEEYLLPARPDLVEAVTRMGIPGANWIVKLRQKLLDQIKGYVKQEKQDIVQAVCDKCGKSWPVPREEFDKIEACPFCGHKQGEEVQREPASEPDVVVEEEES